MTTERVIANLQLKLVEYKNSSDSHTAKKMELIIEREGELDDFYQLTKFMTEGKKDAPQRAFILSTAALLSTISQIIAQAISKKTKRRKKASEAPFDPEFVAQILDSSANSKPGTGLKIHPEDLNNEHD